MANSRITQAADSLKESDIKKKLSRKEVYEAKIKALAANDKWDTVTKSLSCLEENNDKKHQGYRDDMDITLVEHNPKYG